MKPVDVTTEICIACPIELVAAFAANPDNAPKWYVNIRSVKWITEKPLELGSQIAFIAQFLGRTLSYTYEIVAYEPDQLLKMKTANGPFPMQTTYTWESTGDNSTRMMLRNEGNPSGFSKFFAPFMAKAMRKANTKDLEKLKELLENKDVVP